MSLGLSNILGQSGGATQPATTGLRPNQFQLQFGRGATTMPTPAPGATAGGMGTTIAPRTSPLGFGAGTERFEAQIRDMGIAQQPDTTMPTSAGPAADPWASMGPFGQFFKMIDQMRTQNGMPAISENKQFMDMIGNTINRKPGGFTDNGSGN